MSSPTLTLDDYDAIAAAVMETERGRWFLAEYARRNRVADTSLVLEALSALERRLPAASQSPKTPLADVAVADVGVAEIKALPAPAAVEAPAPPEGLIALIEAAVDRAARIRAELSAAPDPGEPIDHALRDCVELDEALGAALEALGKPRSAPAPVGHTAPGSRVPDVTAFARVEPAVTELGLDHDFGWIDIVDFEAELVAPVSNAPDVAAEDRDFTSSFTPDDGLDEHPGDESQDDEKQDAERDNHVEQRGVVANGLAVDEAPPVDTAPLPEPRRDLVAADVAIPRQAPRPRLPLAWTPGLLDRLTPEERAILFA